MLEISINQTVTQSISGSLQLAEYRGECNVFGKWTAHVTFRVVLNGKVVKLYPIIYNIEEYNAFWTNFNTGCYLIDQLIARYPELAGITIPDNIEEDFMNS